MAAKVGIYQLDLQPLNVKKMSIVETIKSITIRAISKLYSIELSVNQVLVNATKPEFEGDYTVVLFAFVKQLKK